MIKLKRILVLYLFAAFFDESHAFTLTPMTISFEPTGPKATQSFQIENESNEPIAIEMTLATRIVDSNGKETQEKLKDPEKYFLLYPPQATIKPKEKRTIRATWVGTPTPHNELNFRLIAEQLPVQNKSKKTPSGASIQILMKYVAALYITPLKAKSKIEIEGKKPEVIYSKTKKLKFTIKNVGNTHQVLLSPMLKLWSKDNKSEFKIDSKDLSPIGGQNILAGHSRNFEIPHPASLNFIPTRAELEFKEQ